MLILCALKQNINIFASHLSMLNFHLVFNQYNEAHYRHLINTISTTCVARLY